MATAIHLGEGAILAKFDLECAYRMVPVHPHDRILLGTWWEGNTYVDGALPFGLRLAPKIFTAVADVLLWIMRRHGVRSAMHYLDDFLLLGPPCGEECGTVLSTRLQLCQSLDVQVAPHQMECPSTVINVLGIQLDTENMIIRLPREKLTWLVGLIRKWRGQGIRCVKKGSCSPSLGSSNVPAG